MNDQVSGGTQTDVAGRSVVGIGTGSFVAGVGIDRRAVGIGFDRRALARRNVERSADAVDR